MIDWLWAVLSGTSFQLMIGAFAVVGLAETARPVGRAKSRAVNALYSAVNFVAVAGIAPILAIGTAKLAPGLIDLRRLHVPAVVAVLLSTLVWEFFYYWMHRAQHASRWLWQEHLVHHSDRHMNVTTSGRTHILEQIVATVFITAPMAALVALPPVSVAAIALVPWAWAYFVHANVRVGFGPLWWLLASPQYHRIHHSLEPPHRDKNFCVWFPLWDILFGTACRPMPGEYPATGVEGVEATTVHGLYLLPFVKWWEMVRHRLNPVDARGRAAS